MLTHCRLITIYDCKIDLKWSGIASDGTEVKGKLKIPEVSHEITLDGLSDYVVSFQAANPHASATMFTEPTLSTSV